MTRSGTQRCGGCARPLEEIQDTVLRDETCEITGQKGSCAITSSHFYEHLQSSEGTIGGKFVWKNGTDRQYKRDHSPRFEWPFGSMPNYFLLVEHSTRRGRDEMVKRTWTASFHRHSTSIWDICSMIRIGIEDVARLLSTSFHENNRFQDSWWITCHIKLFPLKEISIGTCHGDLLSFISPAFFNNFGWHSVVIKWFVWYETNKQNVRVTFRAPDDEENFCVRVWKNGN